MYPVVFISLNSTNCTFFLKAICAATVVFLKNTKNKEDYCYYKLKLPTSKMGFAH